MIASLMRAHGATAIGRRRVTVLAFAGVLSTGGLARGEDAPAEPEGGPPAPTVPTPAPPPAAPRAQQRIDDERPVRRAPRPEPEPAPPSASYGGRIVLADLGALLVGGILSAVSNSGVPLVATWTLTSPAVHLAHNHPGTAGASALLHLGLPVLGVVVGAAIPCSNKGNDSEVPCGFANVLFGGMFGAIGATAIDAAFLAQFPEPPSNRVARADENAGWPELSLGPRRNLSLGWRGRF
jgi:hypothetical protein